MFKILAEIRGFFFTFTDWSHLEHNPAQSDNKYKVKKNEKRGK